MGYSQVALEDKILGMYPEIKKNEINTSIHFDDERDAFVITFAKGGHQRYAFLDKKDADSCMDGIQCIYLGTLIDQYVIDLEKELGMTSS